MSGAPILSGANGGEPMPDDEFFEKGDETIVATIKELLESRVRPAVAQDGGDITFRGFRDGKGVPAHEGRLRRLPLFHGHAQARHPEPASPFRAGSP